MHLIPWKLLRQAVRIGRPDPQPDTEIVMSYQVFRLLLQAALVEQPFDEHAYLAANQDVGQAILAGKCPAAHTHFLESGYFEGRDDGGAGFDEQFYTQRYADVRTALTNGTCTSAYRHFRGEGMLEWRSPNKAAEADIARWRSAIAASAASALSAPKRPAEPLERRKAGRPSPGQVQAAPKPVPPGP